jgi:hypothetical protein
VPGIKSIFMSEWQLRDFFPTAGSCDLPGSALSAGFRIAHSGIPFEAFSWSSCEGDIKFSFKKLRSCVHQLTTEAADKDSGAIHKMISKTSGPGRGKDIATREEIMVAAASTGATTVITGIMTTITGTITGVKKMTTGTTVIIIAAI